MIVVVGFCVVVVGLAVVVVVVISVVVVVISVVVVVVAVIVVVVVVVVVVEATVLSFFFCVFLLVFFAFFEVVSFFSVFPFTTALHSSQTEAFLSIPFPHSEQYFYAFSLAQAVKLTNRDAAISKHIILFIPHSS